MKQAGIEQEFHHLRYATCLMEVHSHVATTGFEITDHGNPLSDQLEIIDVQLHPCRTGDGQQVKHRIGGAADRHDHADRVFEGFPR